MIGKFAKISTGLLIIFFTASAVSNVPDDNTQIFTRYDAIRELENEILQMDSELRRCDRMRRDWRTATIIGGVGVVGTATGAIIQAVQINNANKAKTDATKQ